MCVCVDPQDDLAEDTDDAAVPATANDTAAADGEEDGEDAGSADATTGASSSRVWMKRSHMFPVKSVVGSSKKVSFRRSKDLAVAIYYDDSTVDRLPFGTG